MVVVPPVDPPTRVAPLVAPLVPPPAPAPGAYYSECADARAAGAAPLCVPGYRSEFDRDDGGVACE
ncbi:excalibur calcium-binding domain-containing protein [Rhodococcus jostii]|uniref:excalibur calcium-binding domain-containing protein n=1 Tax=Rhodococcus jostii TaxID=132919 RepID=UPI00363DA576